MIVPVALVVCQGHVLLAKFATLPFNQAGSAAHVSRERVSLYPLARRDEYNNKAGGGVGAGGGGNMKVLHWHGEY